MLKNPRKRRTNGKKLKLKSDLFFGNSFLFRAFLFPESTDFRHEPFALGVNGVGPEFPRKRLASPHSTMVCQGGDSTAQRLSATNIMQAHGSKSEHK
eukprot:5057095-Amphidinium_carterae.1